MKALLLLLLLLPVVAWADHHPPPPYSWTAERIREVDEIVKTAVICPLEGSPEALQRERAARERGARQFFPPHTPTQEEMYELMQHTCSDVENLLSQWEYRHFGSHVPNGLPLEEGGIRESDLRQEERWMQREHNPTWYWASIIDCPKLRSVEDQAREQWHKGRIAAQKPLPWEQRQQQDIDDIKAGTYLRPCLDPEVRWLYEKIKQQEEQKAQLARDKAFGGK